MIKAKNERLEYMDIFRAFGIILMIMGHVGFGEIFYKFIHAFHMPMFFFISGFFYHRKENVKPISYIKKKTITLIKPYLIFGIMHYIIYCVIYGFTISPLYHLFTFNTEGIVIAGALWFLTALFFTEIIYYFLDRWKIKWLIIPLVLIGSFFDKLSPYPLPLALSASFVGLGLYWIGNYVSNNQEKFKLLMNMNWFKCTLYGIVVTILIFLNGFINMRKGIYSFIPLFWINAIVSIFIGISISKKVEIIIKKGTISKWLLSVGRNSIVYVCLNQLIIFILQNVFGILTLPLITKKLFIFVSCMLVLCPLTLLFTNTHLKRIIGK